MENRNSATNYVFDNMKLICVILLVCMYTDAFHSLNSSVDFVLIQLLSKLAFPFCFVCASFNFFKTIDFSIGFNDQRNKDHLFQWFRRMALMYLIWSLLYLPLLIFKFADQGFTLMSFVAILRDFIFVGSYIHLWIFPALMFSVGLLYVLLQSFKFKELLILSFIFYMFGMLINVYGNFLMDIPFVSTILTGYLNIFSTSVNGLFFGFAYVLLGMKLSLIRKPLKGPSLLLKTVIFAILYISEVALLNWLGYVQTQTQMYLFLIPLIYYLMLLLIQQRTNKHSYTLKEMGTLVYLVQFYGIELCKNIAMIYDNAIIYILVVLLMAFMLSWFILKAANVQRKLKVLYQC